MKYRAMDEEYRQWIVKEYEHWTLCVNTDQRYVGRAYAWLAREGAMQRLSEITDEEYAELRIVMREYEAAAAALWQPDFMNYAWLANLFHEHGGHGHLHLVPRYKDTRVFEGIEFADGRWGKNFSPHEPCAPEKRVLEAIRDALRGELQGS